MGVHAVDGMIDLCGAIDHVFCQSFRRVVAIDATETAGVELTTTWTAALCRSRRRP